MAISAELIAALDDLIQTGAQASAALRTTIEQMMNLGGHPAQMNEVTRRLTAVHVAQSVIDNIKAAARTEQSMPVLITKARDTVKQLGDLANKMGDSALASSLGMKVQAFSAQMKADGLGVPWLTVLGIGAGAIAAWYVWKSYSKKTKVASFEYPDSEASDRRPQLRGLSKALGSFKVGGKTSQCRPMGKGKRLGRLGAAEKYEFEPEIRLEGLRGSRRRSKK